MPMPIDNLKIAGTDLDRRRKLSVEQYDQVRDMLKAGHSQRAVARHFGVTHRLIGFIAKPERYAEMYAHKKANGSLPSRESLTAAAASTRAYKKTLAL